MKANRESQPTCQRAGVRCIALLADLVHAYEREVNPASDWRETALTEDEFELATREYRAAKQWLSANNLLYTKSIKRAADTSMRGHRE